MPFNADVTTNQARTGVLMATASMVCVQLGLALSIGLMDQIGAEGAAWLRLAWAGADPARRRAAAARRVHPLHVPDVRRARRRHGGITLLFMASLDRIPLGTASALEFLGPLGVAVAQGRGGADSCGRASPPSAWCC